jgi:hypothetical protein
MKPFTSRKASECKSLTFLPKLESLCRGTNNAMIHRMGAEAFEFPDDCLDQFLINGPEVNRRGVKAYISHFVSIRKPNESRRRLIPIRLYITTVAASHVTFRFLRSPVHVESSGMSSA